VNSPNKISLKYLNKANQYKMTDTITLWELRGILGKIPFSEDELIELIEDGRLNALEIANTSTKLLTNKIKKSLLYNDAFD